jgi:nicotinate phosphoribosyltransferase
LLSGLNTDFYELTMAAGYFCSGLDGRKAAFELFVRKLPEGRSCLVAAGLAQALDFLESLRFEREEIEYLRGLGPFLRLPDAFFEKLGRLRFTGDVHAIPEGTPVFAGEPILRVEAPVIQAQIVETCLLSLINFETSVATKAARIVEAARGRDVMEFGTRRAHGPEAGVLAARAAYVGGCAGTSNVLAGHRFGIPVSGTMAHSWVMAFPREEDAFAAFCRTFPDSTILLIDTYDTIAGARLAAAACRTLQGVRIDSGNVVDLSREVRRILDSAGCGGAKIVVSGDCNEFVIDAMLEAGAEVDIFGVGTELATSKDAPALGGIYKLVAMETEGKEKFPAKISEAKETHPGRKQVFRFFGPDGSYLEDVIALAHEKAPDGALPLLSRVMHRGKIEKEARPPLEKTREGSLTAWRLVPEDVRRLRDPATYPVRRSAALDRLFEEAVRGIGK